VLVNKKTRHRRLPSLQRIGELAHQPNEVGHLPFRPGREDFAAHPLAGRIERIGHRLAFRRDGGFANTAVACVVPANHQFHAFEPGHLAADGRTFRESAVGGICVQAAQRSTAIASGHW
jgi:hypothetical protein